MEGRVCPDIRHLANYPSSRVEIKMMNICANALLIAVSSALLWHFSNIWRYGRHIIEEPNTMIMGLETGMLVGIIAFGAVKLMRDSLTNKAKTG